MHLSTPILRTLFSLVLLLSFLLGSAASTFAADDSAASKAAVEKSGKSDQAVVKPGLSPEATVSAVSIKFHQIFCDFIRQYVLRVDLVRVTESGYPVFRDTYFAKIFSHLIVTNAP